jgi:uncharacterized protein YjiS (DUF1127 family)
MTRIVANSIDQSAAKAASTHPVRKPQWLLARFFRWMDRQRQRRLLAELDDHLLKDIGISREQAMQAAAKWFWQK